MVRFADCVCVQADVAAGLSVAAMVVPQGLSYAKLAGLPQVWGLYGAFSPCIVYAAFGSSKQLVRSLSVAALSTQRPNQSERFQSLVPWPSTWSLSWRCGFTLAPECVLSTCHLWQLCRFLQMYLTIKP